MSITIITGGTQAAGVNNGNPVTLTFPTLQENDVVIVFGGHFARGGTTSAVPSGYTTIYDSGNTLGTDPHFAVSYKVMGATPDVDVSCPGSGNGSDGTAYGCYCLRGVDTSNIQDATRVPAGPTTSNNPDAPSIDTATNGALVLALALDHIAGVGDTSITLPSGYSELRTARGADSNDATVAGGAFTKASAGTENPPSFTTWTAGTWRSCTVAVRPAPIVLTANNLTVGSPVIGGASWSRVQGKGAAPGGPSSSIAITLDATVGVGNAVVGGCSWGSPATVLSVTDDQGNTYTVLFDILDTADSQRAAVFYRGNVTNAPQTITVNLSQNASFQSILVDEFSGCVAETDPKDAGTGQYQASPGTGTDAVTSGSFSTTINGDLVWGFTANTGGSGAATSGTGFTDSTYQSSTPQLNSEYLTQTSFGSIAATFTIGANLQHITGGIGLKAALGPVLEEGEGNHKTLTATALTVSSPSFGAPALTQHHTLTADALVVQSPSFGTPSLSVTVSLTADNLTVGSPVLDAPALATNHTLTADALAVGSPVLGTPAITQKHAFDQPDRLLNYEEAGAYGSTIFGGSTTYEEGGQSVQFPVATKISAIRFSFKTYGSPTDAVVVDIRSADGSVLHQTSLNEVTPYSYGALHTFYFNQFTLQADTSYLFMLRRTGALDPNNAYYFDYHLVSRYADGGTWKKNGGTYQSAFPADCLFGLYDKVSVASPVLGTPTLTQHHTLAADNLTTASPVLDTPTVSLLHTLIADALTVQSPVFGSPAITQGHALDASALTVASPAFGTPAVAQTHALVADALAVGSPVPGTPALVQHHVLTADALTVASPALGTPSLAQSSMLTADALAVSSPVLGTPAITQGHVVVADALAVSSPVLAAPSLAQHHVLTADALTVQSPVSGTPELSVNTGMVATALVVGSPVLDAPTLVQAHVLTADALAVASPVLDAPALVQTHALTADGLTVGSPVLGTPALAQTSVLTADALTVGSPVLGSPTMAQVHALIANAFSVGSPVLGTPAFGINGTLAADALVVASPEFGTPALAQRHVLTADTLTVASPQFGASALIENYTLIADALAVGSPQMGSPDIGQYHILDADDLVVGPPYISDVIMNNRRVYTGVLLV